MLILGKGFVGTRLYNFLSSKAEVEIIDKKTIDYTDRKTFNLFIRDKTYKTIINCSGYTGSPNVDGCELNKHKCLFYNVSVPVQLAQLCSENNIKFINVSSGCIYTGYEKSFSEKDKPNFGVNNLESSYYSFTKHLCEISLEHTNAITIRLRMPFNSDVDRKNLIYKVLKYDNIIDYNNSGTNTDDLNEFILGLVNHNDFLKIKGPLNVVNSGILTCKLISEYLSFHGLTNPNWKIVELADLNIVAQRSNCILSDKKIKKLKLGLPPIPKSLKEAVAKFVENYKKHTEQAP
jgi:dTDP-4-dehydrorhamnose reductase